MKPVFSVYFSKDPAFGANTVKSQEVPLNGQDDYSITRGAGQMTLYGHLDANGSPIHPLGFLMYGQVKTFQNGEQTNAIVNATAYFDQDAADDHGIAKGTIYTWVDPRSGSEETPITRAGTVRYSPKRRPKTGDECLVKFYGIPGNQTQRLEFVNKGYF